MKCKKRTLATDTGSSRTGRVNVSSGSPSPTVSGVSISVSLGSSCPTDIEPCSTTCRRPHPQGSELACKLPQHCDDMLLNMFHFDTTHRDGATKQRGCFPLPPAPQSRAPLQWRAPVAPQAALPWVFCWSTQQLESEDLFNQHRGVDWTSHGNARGLCEA